MNKRLCTLYSFDAKSDCNQKRPATGFINRHTHVAFHGCTKTAFITAKDTGFIQKIATIFQGLVKDHIRFSKTTY